MKRIHVVGRKNHGKTQLVVDLVQEFRRRGLIVGTIKHTHHRHELDTPGKDSHRHWTAGAAPVGIVSPTMNAIFLPAGDVSSDDDASSGEDRYAAMAPLFSGCALVVVEGDSHTSAPKIEVWRAMHRTAPLCGEDSSILAVVTDDSPPVTTTILPRTDVPRLAEWLLERQG